MSSKIDISNNKFVKANGITYTWPASDTVGGLTSDGAGNLSWGGGSAFLFRKVVELTLSGTDITNGYKDLTEAVDDGTFTFTEVSRYTTGGYAGEQRYSLDFTVTKHADSPTGVYKRIYWKTSTSDSHGDSAPTSGLVGTLVSGDILKVSYNYKSTGTSVYSASNGLEIVTNDIRVKLPGTTPGLYVNGSDQLDVKRKSGGGVQVDANGIYVDGSTVTASDASQFEIFMFKEAF